MNKYFLANDKSGMILDMQSIALVQGGKKQHGGYEYGKKNG
jgi:hypothetical protein